MALFRLAVVAALTTSAVEASSCSIFSAIDAVDAAGASANCSACVGATGCSFCLQTLQCGPASELALSCRDALAAASGECPLPSADLCTDQADCGSCMAVAGCAWCASAASCMPASATFSSGCRGTVFDLPCPAVFTPRNDVVGDLTVQPDPVLGGGALRVTGESPSVDSCPRNAEVKLQPLVTAASELILTAPSLTRPPAPPSSFLCHCRPQRDGRPDAHPDLRR